MTEKRTHHYQGFRFEIVIDNNPKQKGYAVGFRKVRTSFRTPEGKRWTYKERASVLLIDQKAGNESFCKACLDSYRDRN